MIKTILAGLMLFVAVPRMVVWATNTTPAANAKTDAGVIETTPTKKPIKAPAATPETNLVAPQPTVAADIAVDLKLGIAIKNRQVVEDAFFESGQTVFAWTRVIGLADGQIQHVWYRDGIEVARHDLNVKNAKRWRTWTRSRVRPGQYEIQILGPNGNTLAQQTFEVFEVGEDEGC